MEDEGYASFPTIEKMHWALSNSDGLYIFTDENNPVFLFDNLSVVPDLLQPSLSKALRWAIRQSAYHYTFGNINGEENHWADRVERGTYRDTIHRLVHILVLPATSNEDFVLPTPFKLATIQETI